MALQAELILDQKATLGEGALWDAHAQRLYWVDILENRVYIYDPVTGENRAIDVGQHVGAVVPRASGGLMLALKGGFARLDLETEEVVPITDPEADLPRNRFNDGKCDPQGRFWAGTMAYAFDKGAGSLYRLDADGTADRVLTGITCSNGLVWTSDQKLFYYIDTPTHQVHAFDYEPRTGAIANRRIAIDVPSAMGFPDGMTIDAKDHIWVALWGGSLVACWDPKTGELLETVEVPASHVTSCAFGAKALDQLFITTARDQLTQDQLAAEPHAGGLFRVEPGVSGVPAPSYAG